MASSITEASVLAAFDEKVRDGIVMYAEDMEKIYHEDQGFKFEFRLTAALKSKPAAVEDNAELDDADDEKGPSQTTSTSTSTTTANTVTPSHANTHTNDTKHTNDKITLDEEGNLPGGDISIAGFELTTIPSGGGEGDEEATHVLAFNKFCAYRPHLLLLTADGRRRQFEGLDKRDLGAAVEVLGGLNGGWGSDADADSDKEKRRQEYLVIFNCGKEGGCSRLHKHMQAIPAPDAIPMWPDLVDSGPKTEADDSGKQQQQQQQQEPPFRYFIHHFTGPSPPSKNDLTASYKHMLRQATELIPGREKVVEEDGDGRAVAVPHNVILGRRWIVVVPRVKAGVDGADVNAVGMLGVVWASKGETVGKWRELGARRVLGEVGVRR